jgi:hypothetical protein
LKLEVTLRTKPKASCYFFPIIVFLLVVFSLFDTALAFEEYTVTSEAKVSAKGAKEFRLTAPGNLGGQITLQVWDDDHCLVRFECWAKANTEEKAKKFAEMVDLSLEREEEIVTLKLDTPHPAPWEGTNYGIKATLEIYIPHDFMLYTKTSAFDLDISGPLKQVFIDNHYGGVQLKDVSEETNISTTYGEVNAEDLEGSLNIETTYDSISLSDINTKKGKAFIKTNYGKIDLERFRGQLEANTIYSSIYGSDITLSDGRNEIKTVYSKIDLDFSDIKDAELYVKNTYGNINVVVPKDLSARLLLTVGRGGKIHTRGILIKPSVLHKTRLEGTCGKGESDIEIDIDGIGEISLEGR